VAANALRVVSTSSSPGTSCRSWPDVGAAIGCAFGICLYIDLIFDTLDESMILFG